MPEQEKAQDDSPAANNHDNATPAKHLLRWAFIIGAIAWLILIFVSIYHPYLTERVKFFVGSTLSLFVLLAVIVQAVIYQGQWGAMQGQLSAVEDQAEIMRRTLSHNERTFDATWKLGTEQLKSMTEQVHVMEKQAIHSEAQMEIAAEAGKIMQGQLELMKRQTEASAVSARAYLGIKSVGITNPIVKSIIINAVLFNGGQTPAWNVEPRFQVGMVKSAPRPFDWDAPATQISDAGLTSTFFPAAAEKRISFPEILNVTKENFGEFERGERNIYVDGQIRFTDHMGIKQIFGFGMICTSKDNGEFRERYQYQRNADPN